MSHHEHGIGLRVDLFLTCNVRGNSMTQFTMAGEAGTNNIARWDGKVWSTVK